MGTTDRGIYLPTPVTEDTAWGPPVNDNFSRLADLAYNVKAYGAVGDGVTNDAVALQAAIDAAVAAGGGTVFFPKGQYNCDSTLTINADSVALRGANFLGSRIQFGNAVNPGLDLGDNVTLRHYITIDNLTLTRATAGGGPIVRGRKVDQVILSNSKFSSGTNTLNFDQLISSSITNCGISSATLRGMWFQNCDQVQIVGNYFEDQNADSTHLVFVSGNKNFSVVGNNFSSGSKALEIGTGANTDHSITGNTVENCLHGFGLIAGGSGLTRSSVTGNALRGTGVAGGLGVIVDSTVQTCSITANVVTNYAGNLLQGTPGTGTRLVGNPGITDV